jgi:hypothetical protein
MPSDLTEFFYCIIAPPTDVKLYNKKLTDKITDKKTRLIPYIYIYIWNKSVNINPKCSLFSQNWNTCAFHVNFHISTHWRYDRNLHSTVIIKKSTHWTFTVFIVEKTIGNINIQRYDVNKLCSQALAQENYN